MKKGKTSRINNFESLKVNFGTVDSKNLKSIYINIQSWVNPKISSDNWNRVVCNLSREIKHSVYNNLDRTLYEEKTIVDLDLRTSGIVYGKKSFLNLEINFFMGQPNLDFKCSEIKNCLKDITKKIVKDNFNNNNYFSFTLTKKDKNNSTEI